MSGVGSGKLEPGLRDECDVLCDFLWGNEGEYVGEYVMVNMSKSGECGFLLRAKFLSLLGFIFSKKSPQTFVLRCCHFAIAQHTFLSNMLDGFYHRGIDELVAVHDMVRIDS